MKRESVWWAYLAFLVLLYAPAVFPLLGRENGARLAVALDPLAVSGLLGVLLYRWRQIGSDAERIFWGLTTLGCACWWLAEVLVALFPSMRSESSFHLFIDGLYLLLFLFSLAAVELRPDLGRPIGDSLTFKSGLEIGGLLFALVALSFYFVLIPRWLDPRHYGEWIHSSMLYAMLDLLVALRYSQIARRARSPRWRFYYRMIGLMLAIWFMLDTVQAMARAGWFGAPQDSPVRVLWALPLLTLATVAVSRRHRFDDALEPAEEPDALGGLYRSGSSLIVLAFVLPLMHNGLSALGLLLPIYQPARDWLVVAALTVLGSLLLIEHGSQKARTRRERKRLELDAEQSLARSEERFRTLAAASFEGVIIHDGKTVIDANEQLATMFGFPLEEAIGAAIGSRVAAVDKERLGERVRQGPNPVGTEFRAYRKDRTPFLCEVRSRHLPSLAGSGMRVAVLRDVTEHRRLEHELRQAQKMEAIGRLAGGIAHDFNNLLTVILATCDLVSKESFEEDIERICSAAGKAGDLTQQLLAFSRQQRLELEILDLNQVVGEAEPLLRRLLPEPIELVFDVADDLEPVHADRSQLVQVVMNLAINARDAMPSGGRLEILTRRAPEPVAAGVWLEVRDQGEGIDPEDLDRIFEPFFTPTELGQGTGLGLATVHGIVRQVGGTITVRSEPGRGTSFRVELPAAESREAEPAEDPAASVESAVSASGTILIVEDQVEIVRVAEHFLTSVGYDVLSANDAPEAYDIALSLEEPIALLLADVVLPHESGLEVADRLGRRWPGLKVLFMTGYPEGPLIESLGDRPLLRKPFDRQRLLAKVREVLEDRDDETS